MDPTPSISTNPAQVHTLNIGPNEKEAKEHEEGTLEVVKKAINNKSMSNETEKPHLDPSQLNSNASAT